MPIFYAIVPGQYVNPVQTALQAAYGTRLNSASPDVSNLGANSPNTELDIDVNDDTIQPSDISTVITNAIGQYVSVSNTQGSPTGGIGSLNLGATLNSWGGKITAFFKSLGLGTLNILEWALIALAILLVAYVTLSSLGKGIGEGLATRV